MVNYLTKVSNFAFKFNKSINGDKSRASKTK